MSFELKRISLGVDDFYMASQDKDLLLRTVPRIREVLATLKLTLHPKKFYLQHYTKGVSFTGSIVKPGRVYVEGRTLNNFMAAVLKLNRATCLEQIYKGVDSVNSYLGLLKHCNEYASRRRILGKLNRKVFKYCYIRGHFEVLCIKNRYKRRNIILQKIRDGTFYDFAI